MRTSEASFNELCGLTPNGLRDATTRREVSDEEREQRWRKALKGIAEDYTRTGSRVWDDILNRAQAHLLPEGFRRPQDA